MMFRPVTLGSVRPVRLTRCRAIDVHTVVIDCIVAAIALGVATDVASTLQKKPSEKKEPTALDTIEKDELEK